MVNGNMRDIILELVENKPKHYSKIVKNTPAMLDWVRQHTLIESSILAEQIFSAVYQASNICENGKIKKFVSFSNGFKGCGIAARCECVRKQVSSSVSESKKHISVAQQATTNKIRSATNLQKYGVECVAQLPANIKKFKDWYANPENVEKNLDKIKRTNLQKYGVENCKSLPEVEQKIIATCLARYGVENVSQIPSTKAKLKARTAEYKLTGHLIKKGYDRFSLYVNENFNFNVTTSKDEYTGIDSGQLLHFSCIECGHQKYSKFHYNRGLNCDFCNPRVPSFVSGEEQAVYDFISNELGIVNGIQGDKTLINPYELDMIFTDQKIAIEYCGLYWHSELSSGKQKTYHYDKMLKTKLAGYRLITIFSDEWLLRNDIVKSKLRNIFKKTTQRHYARNLTVKLADSMTSKNFLDANHLQGNSSAKINLGLYAADTLVALMTFSNGRAALNTPVMPDEYELVRFVTNGSSVVGGASKLLTNFIRLYNTRKITSYADNRWSEGAVYDTIGFTAVGKPTIGYWYVDNYTRRLHRYNFTKSNLVREGNDPTKTEWQIMQDLGYDKIWDCGHQKYILQIF